jgi:hypothetical protein
MRRMRGVKNDPFRAPSMNLPSTVSICERRHGFDWDQRALLDD